MTLAELDTALTNRLPVIHDYRNTASPGEYFYSYVSGIIKRYSDDENKLIIQAEVKNVTHNATAIVDPTALRYATPEEFTNYYKKLEERNGKETEQGDSLLLLET